MAAPIVRGIGAFGSGTTSFTAAVPTGANAPQLGDAMYIVMESTDSTTTAGTPTTPNGGSGNAFNKLFEQTFAAGSSVEPAVSTLTVFGKIVQAGDNANVTISGVGNHCAGAMVVVGNHGLNAITDTVVGTATNHGTTTANNLAPSITVTANSLVILAIGFSDDAADTTNVSGVVNANLANIVEQRDQTVTAGSGGGVGIYTATCAGTSTGTTEWDHDTAAQSESMQLGIKPMSFQPDDNENGWWAGVQECFTSVATAGIAAVALSSTLCWAAQQYTDELPRNPIITGSESWQVFPVGDSPLPVAFIADDEIVPQAAPTLVVEDYWWQPQQTISVELQSLNWTDEDLPRVSLISESESWQVTAIGEDTPAQPSWADDDLPVTAEITTAEEDYWQQPQQQITVTFGQLPWGEDETVPVSPPDETAWQVYTPPLLPAQPLLEFQAQDEAPYPLSVEEIYWYQPATDLVEVTVVDWPAAGVGGGGSPPSAGIVEEDYWQIFPPEVRPVVQLWQTEDELPASFVDEDYWFAPQAQLELSRPTVFSADEEIVPQPVTFIPDEDYWYQGRIDRAEVTVVAWPPTGVGGGGVPESTAIGFTEPDWQVWTPPLVAAKPLYLPDPEQVPAGLIAEQPGGGGYGYTQRLVYTTAFKLWGQADELPTPLEPAPPEEDYWLQLQAYPGTAQAPVYRINEEIVPQPGPGVPNEEYWYQPGTDKVEITIVNWPAAGTGTGGPTFPAEITVVESDWQVWTPPLTAARPLYLPDPEQIPASFLSVQRFSHGLGKAIISRAISTPTFKQWPSTDDFPTRTAIGVEDTPWQVYTPPLVATKGLYLPDPEQVPAGLAAPALIEEEDWRVWTPSLLAAQPIYLPDPIAGEVVPQPALEEPEWQVWTPQPPAPVTLYWLDQEEVLPERTTAGPVEDYWFTLQPQAPITVTTLWNEDDQLVPQIVPLPFDEEFWQVWTPKLVAAQGLYLPDPSSGDLVPIPPRPPRLYIDITTGQLYLAVQGVETGSPIRLIPL